MKKIRHTQLFICAECEQGFLHTLVILQLLLHLAEFFFGPLQTLLQSGDFRSMRGGSRYRRQLITEER